MSQYPNQPYQPSGPQGYGDGHQGYGPAGGPAPYGPQQQPGYPHAGYGPPGNGYGQQDPGYRGGMPQAPAKVRRPMLWLGVGAAILLLVLVLIGFFAAKSAGPVKGKVGQEIKAGKYTATVKSVDCSKSEMTQYGKSIPASRGQYCVIALSLTNNDSKAVSLSSKRSKLMVGKDEHLADDNFNSGFMGNGLDAARLEAGQSNDYSVVFDSPTDQPDRFVLTISSSGGTIDVSLK